MYYYYMHIKCWNLCGFALNKISLTFQKGTSIDMQLVHNNVALAPSVQSNVSLYQRMKGGNIFRVSTKFPQHHLVSYQDLLDPPFLHKFTYK